MSRLLKGITAACIAVALACGACALAACSQAKDAGSGTLRVGVRNDITGFGYLNEQTGKYYGLEIDLATELASRLGYADVEFSTVTPSDRKDTLQNGDVDCLVACYSVSESREENFDFSPAYYEDKSVLLVESSSLIKKLSDLKGCTIGTMAGTNAAPQLAAKLAEDGFSDGKVLEANDDNSHVVFDNYELRQYASYDELSQALECGEVDAAAMDGAVAQAFLKDNRNIMDYTIATQDYAVATQKDSELGSKVSEQVQGMLDDGTVAKLVDKWD